MKQAIQQIEPLVEEFMLREEKDLYVLSFQSNEDLLGDPMKQLARTALSDQLQMMGDKVFESMVFHSIYYEMNINQTTHFIENVHLKMDFDLTIDGTNTNILQDMTMTYSNYNEIGEIVVPVEIIEHAVEGSN